MPNFTQRHVTALTITALLLGMGCSSTPRARAVEPSPMAVREMQTRAYDTGDEAFVLAAAVGVLQDLGFTLDESAPALGVLVASKERSVAPPTMGSKAAEASREIAGGLFSALLASMVDSLLDTDSNSEAAHEKWHEQKEEVETYVVKEQIRVSLITRPHGDDASSRVTVRLIFGRSVWDNLGQESRLGSLTSAEEYDKFFAKLNQAVFLEAHQI